MEGGGRGLTQLAVLQELRARYGIKVKRRPGKEKEGTVAPSRAGAGKVFGIALHKLPHQAVPEYGSIPCFLVEACEYLEEYIHTEGLFRKSGSVVRLKALKSKLEQGANCLSEAQPCDVAGLLKQFFRELPEPVFPSHLQEAFIKAQQLDTEEKNSATLLLSCLLDDRTSETLRYFFSFLKKVSLRSTENKMDSSNLAVIFAPNLFLSNKKLGLQVAVVQALIDRAENTGNVPKYILDKMPVMLGVDDPVSTPLPQNYGESEGETPGGRKRRRRQSLGVFPSVTPVLVTPSTKRKYPADSVQGFSNKKMRSLRHNLALELLPNSVFNSSTPASAQFEASPCMSLEASQSLLSTSVTSDMQSVGSRRSKRIASKKVQRVESGKMGCFSPKISRKEMVRRSLRLKFLLGKSSKENAVVEHPATRRSETIGRRLASQTETENGTALVQTVALSPRVGKSITKKGSKNISKSEENLQMANCSNEASFRISWTGCCTTEPQETYNSTYLMANLETCSSEPALTTRKAAVVPTICRLVDGTIEQNSNGQHNSFCEDESSSATRTLLKIKRAFSESGSNLHNLLETQPPELNLARETVCISGLDLKQQLSESPAQKMTAVEQKTLFTSSVNKPSVIDKHLSNTDQVNFRERSLFPTTTETNSLLLDLSGSDGLILEDHVPGVPPPGIHENSTETLELTLQSTPEKISEDKELRNCNSGGTKETLETRELLSKLEKDDDGSGNLYLSMETHEKSSPPGKVADHIHWFNKLSLNESCSVAKTKSPLKFQRTPVRQSVRRMNSLLEANKHSTTCKLKKPHDGCLSLDKSVSHETVLSYSETVSSTGTTSHDQLARSSVSCPQLTHPVEQARRPDTTCKVKSITANQSKSVLEDRTNHEIPKTVATMNINLNNSVPTPDRSAVRKLVVEKKTRYRGSPKNPIATAKLLAAIKPLDF